MAGPELSGAAISSEERSPAAAVHDGAAARPRGARRHSPTPAVSRSVSRLLFPPPLSWLAVMLSLPFPWFAFWVSFLVALARSQSPVQTFFPGSIPLANRSPYLSAWHPSANGSGEVSSSWPTFWDQKVRVLCLCAML